MKKMKFFLNLSFIALLGLMVFSCNPDEADPPTITLESGAGLISSDANIDANTPFSIRLRGVKGGSALKSLTIQVDGTTIDAGKLSGDVASGLAAIPEVDQDQFTYEITIISHSEGTSEYAFILTDEAGESDDDKINITVSAGPLSISESNGQTVKHADDASLVDFSIKARIGENDLTNIAITDASGNLVPTDDLRWGESNVKFDSNPKVLNGDDIKGFEKTIYILASKYGNNNFKVTVTDAKGDKAELDLTIHVGQPFDDTYTVTVFNADGPKQGSVDLHAGTMVSSSDPLRDLMDGGIDLAQPVATNWKRSFKAVLGATMVVPTGADYTKIASREQAENMYSAGTEVTESNALNVGAVLIVRTDVDSDGEFDYFVINIDQVNNTDADNEDNFVISVKPSLDK